MVAVTDPLIVIVEARHARHVADQPDTTCPLCYDGIDDYAPDFGQWVLDLRQAIRGPIPEDWQPFADDAPAHP